VYILYLLKDLIRLKVESLFHDPPHKTLLIRFLGAKFGEEHEKIARRFRDEILKDTRFIFYPEHLKNLVVLSDSLASSIERRILRIKGSVSWPSGVYVENYNLLNIFDPRRKTLLIDGNIDLEKIVSKIKNMTDETNKILRKADHEKVGDTILYNILYLIYELTWIKNNIPYSLADTRVPTHTTFDHLYATAAMSNMISFDEDKEVLRGYYVVIDFPGIQRFISSGRKTGDFWAASWLASNIMWSIAEEFAGVYGFDVIISPTSRFNPYAVRSVESWLSKIDEIEIGEVIKEIKKIFNCIYGYIYGTVSCEKDVLQKLYLQPIIPATISMLLPSIAAESSDKLADKIAETYKIVWRRLVDEDIINKIRSRSTEDCVYMYLNKVLERNIDLVSTPPQGLRIYVVDIERLYKRLTDCLNKDLEACRELSLKIDHNSFEDLTKRYEINIHDITSMLLWHSLSTRATDLAEKFGNVKIPAPRSFWTHNDDALTPVSKTYVDAKGDWQPCNLCGYEPAVLRFSKKPGQDDYIDEVKESIKKDISECIKDSPERDSEIFNSIMRIFKPGEALGPYCILKRATYLANKDKLSFISTDDIALEAMSHIVKDLKIIEKLGEKDLKIELEYLLSPLATYESKDLKSIKDIERVVYALRLEKPSWSFESFVSKASEILHKICVSSATDLEFINRFMTSFENNILRDVSSAKKIMNDFREKFKDSSVKKYGLRVDEMCKMLYLPISYAVIKTDADNVGKLIMGDLGVVGLKIDDYLKELLNSVDDATKSQGLSEELREIIIRNLKERFDVLKDLLKTLNLKDQILISPSWTTALSLSLILSSLYDHKIVDENYGALIFSGGDDVIALTPSMTALNTVYMLRRHFSYEPFKKLGVKPVPNLPTGRSVSLRFVNLKDLMSEEFREAIELLEEVSKKVSWTYNGRSFYKDSLVVSDSRTNIRSLIPLNREFENIIEKSLLLSYLVSIGIISSGISNDYINITKDPKILPEKALEVFGSYVLSRNISLTNKNVVKKFIEEFVEKDQGLKEFIKISSNINGEVHDEKINLLTEIINLTAIMRRHL
jgi:CRISPR-associated protein Cmr2